MELVLLVANPPRLSIQKQQFGYYMESPHQLLLRASV